MADESAPSAEAALLQKLHESNYLPRTAAGDAAAASAASVAAISPDVSQRKTAAHLYALRTASRIAPQLRRLVAERSDKDDQIAEVETAIGAELQPELAAIFSEVSEVFSKMASAHAALPHVLPSAPSATDEIGQLKARIKRLEEELARSRSNV